MIRRYSRPAMAALFTDEARLARWLEVEVLAAEALASVGVVPEVEAKAIRERAPELQPPKELPTTAALSIPAFLQNPSRKSTSVATR